MAEKFMQKVRSSMERKGTVGALRKSMGAKEGEKIPSERLQSAAAALKAKAKKGKLSPAQLKRSRRVQIALRFRGK